MRFPVSLTAGLAAYILRNKLRPPPEWQRDAAAGNGSPFRILGSPKPATATAASTKRDGARHPLIHKRFPLVLMLEPLHACNLTCTGCGRIREYEDTMTQRLTLEQCLRAADECGAPIVSIAGGEPLLYPEIALLVEGLLARNRHIYLCTNGLLLRKRLHEFRPDPRLFFNIHLDGLEETHDRAVERAGVFREAIEAIRAAKAAGFKVSTNTTIYKDTEMAEIERLFEFLEPLGLDGHMLSPAYGYPAVNRREIFMTREDVREKFRDIDRLARRFRLNATPVYLEFLQGKRDLPCTAWGNPTYNVKGWKAPCYLITDAHYATFEEFMTRTPWDDYGRGRDPRCEHCMVHCGYEPSAALGIHFRPGDAWKMLRWALK
ncbi:MAG: adenosyl-hopene transferase HpnH [Bryobacterales bacterium]|nr:adenosyl-hopene transferase HpnH [Bryobacteraceae bacterium]MDW8130518.1 adenosyl-hopene transferase HpnH [Bryobacterales bacterium]